MINNPDNLFIQPNSSVSDVPILPLNTTPVQGVTPEDVVIPAIPQAQTTNPSQAGVQGSGIFNPDEIFNIAQRVSENTPKEGLTDEWSPFKTGNPALDYVANLLPNALHDFKEIGTGVVSMLTHPMEHVINPITEWATEKAPYETLGERAADIVNYGFGTKAAGLDVKKATEAWKARFGGDTETANAIGNDMRQEFTEAFRKNPLIVTSMLFPHATANVTGKVVRAAGDAVEKVSKGKVAWGKSGKQAGRIQDIAVADTSNEFRHLRKEAKAMVDEAKSAGGKSATANLAEVIYNRENNIPMPERLKKVDLAYDRLLEKELNTQADIGIELAESLSRNQYRANKEGITYQQAAKDFTPFEEMLYDGVEASPLDIERRLTRIKGDEKLSKSFEKKFSELTPDEVNNLLDHLTPEELTMFKELDYTVNEGYNALKGMSAEIKKNWGGKNLSEIQKIKLKENRNKIAELAAAGDSVAAQFLEAQAGIEAGTLKPVIHAGVKDVAKLGGIEQEGRRLAGKGSSREYGTATPEQLAEAWTKELDNTIQYLAEAKMDRYVSNQLAKGTFPDGTPLASEASKTVKYLDRTLLEEGKLQSALSTVKDAVFEGAIPIDEVNLNALNNQFNRSGSNLYSGVMNDAYGLLKDAILSSGTYLGGNLLSGVAQAIINSNVFLVDDVLNAVKSQGKLSQRLGTFRDLGKDTRSFTNKGAKALHNINRTVGGKLIADTDAGIQNVLTEIAANAKLRKMGIKSAQRADFLDRTSKANLAEIIENVKGAALINPSRTLVPKSLQPLAGLNPFWRWQDTAMQSTYRTLMDNPRLSQLVASNFFGTIGFDEEMQNRLGLGVKTDKPLVSYRMDGKTGKLKEINMDFLPQLTVLKAVTEPASLARSVPLLSDMVNAAQGKNSYGKPFQRTHEGNRPTTYVDGMNRYKLNPKTGQVEKAGGMADEVISTTLRDIWGVPNLYNKTLAPSVAGLINQFTGSDIKFYQPHGQSVFGSFRTGQADNPSAVFSSGDPTKGWAGQQTIRRLLNMYETDYIPENQMRMNKNFIRGVGRRGLLEQQFLEGLR